MENTESNPPFLWVGEPTQRTSFGILSFCITTMLICIWGTVHFNIPTTRHSLIHRLLLQAAWMFIALIAPEALLYIAVHQRIDAGTLQRKAMKCLPSQQ